MQVDQPERGKALLLIAVKDCPYPWRLYFLPVILFSVPICAPARGAMSYTYMIAGPHQFCKTKKIIKLIRGSHLSGCDPASLLLAASVRAVKGAAHRFAASPLTALLSGSLI